jgi:two-component system nitrogen regulation sensor histidine kinase GlnL
LASSLPVHRNCAAVAEPETAPAWESAAFHRGLINGMRCGIVTIDRQGNLVMLNDHARHILDLGEAPEPGQPVDEALRDYPQLVQILKESFTTSSLPNRAEIELPLGNEKGKTIGFTLSLVPNERGVPVGSAIFFKDLTHVEHREEQERLKNRLAALGQMAANLAHEIRNPLASIKISCQLLERRLGPQSASRDLLDKIIAEVRRLNGTITSSLEFVRPLEPSFAPSNVESILDDAVRVAIGRRGKPGIRIVRRREDRTIPVFLMDRAQLRQVFENLLLNAMEAMGDEGELLVETFTTPAPACAFTPYRPKGQPTKPWQNVERYVGIRIRDTGPGIPEDLLDKLFHPFFTTKTQGSGVGLSIAKKVVDSHWGLIDVRSRPGEGAEFTVRLPMVESTQEH